MRKLEFLFVFFGVLFCWNNCDAANYVFRYETKITKCDAEPLSYDVYSSNNKCQSGQYGFLDVFLYVDNFSDNSINFGSGDVQVKISRQNGLSCSAGYASNCSLTQKTALNNFTVLPHSSSQISFFNSSNKKAARFIIDNSNNVVLGEYYTVLFKINKVWYPSSYNNGTNEVYIPMEDVLLEPDTNTQIADLQTHLDAKLKEILNNNNQIKSGVLTNQSLIKKIINLFSVKR